LRRARLVAGASLLAALNACREPPPRLSSPAAGARIGGDALTVTVDASGAYTVTFDGVGHGTGPVPLEHVGDGPHRLAVRDAEGRIHDEREIYIDRTPPTLRLLRPGPVLPYGLAPGAAVEVVATVADASPPLTVTSGAETLKPDADGRYRLRAVLGPGPLIVELSARDAAGNGATARLEAAPGLVQWQAPMPIEAGAWTGERTADDAVLLGLGEAAVVIGPDGRERFGIEVTGHVLAEARALPDDGALLRLLHPVNPEAARVERIEGDGRRTAWSRSGGIPLALAAAGAVPFVAWRTNDGPQLARAPLPWPPAGPVFSPLPCEPRRLRPAPGGDALVATCADSVVVLSLDGAVLGDAPIGPDETVVVQRDAVSLGSPTAGLRALPAKSGATASTVDTTPVRALCAHSGPVGGWLAAVGVDGTVRRFRDAQPLAGGVTPWPRGVPVEFDVEGCAGRHGATLYPVDAPPRTLPGPIAGVVRVGGRHLAVVEGEPPQAFVVGPVEGHGDGLEAMPLTPLAAVNRVVVLPDGLLVAGPAAARPDHGLVLRLTLAEISP
jgi:hypothetical protein